jgi:hypothetical protein
MPGDENCRSGNTNPETDEGSSLPAGAGAWCCAMVLPPTVPVFLFLSVLFGEMLHLFRSGAKGE